MVTAVAPDHADRIVEERLREDGIVHVEPVLLDGAALDRVQIDTQVLQARLPGGCTPTGDAAGEIERLGARLLIVARGECTMPRSPGISGIGIEAPQVGKHAVRAVGVGDVGDQKIDHAAPLFGRGPPRVVFGDRRRCLDEIAVMEMMVVELGFRAEARRIALQGAPFAVVVELLLSAVRGVEPVLELGFDDIEEIIPGLGMTDLVGDMGELREPPHLLARPIGVERRDGRGPGEDVLIGVIDEPI